MLCTDGQWLITFTNIYNSFYINMYQRLYIPKQELKEKKIHCRPGCRPMPSFLLTTGTGCHCSALALQHTALVVLHLLYLHRTAPQCSPHTCYTGEQLKLKHTGIATFATSALHWCTARHYCYMCNAPQCFAHTYYTTVYHLQYNTTILPHLVRWIDLVLSLETSVYSLSILAQVTEKQDIAFPST